jgi:hypothetical protein
LHAIPGAHNVSYSSVCCVCQRFDLGSLEQHSWDGQTCEAVERDWKSSAVREPSQGILDVMRYERVKVEVQVEPRLAWMMTEGADCTKSFHQHAQAHYSRFKFDGC